MINSHVGGICILCLLETFTILHHWRFKGQALRLCATASMQGQTRISLPPPGTMFAEKDISILSLQNAIAADTAAQSLENHWPRAGLLFGFDKLHTAVMMDSLRRAQREVRRWG